MRKHLNLVSLTNIADKAISLVAYFGPLSILQNAIAMAFYFSGLALGIEEIRIASLLLYIFPAFIIAMSVFGKRVLRNRKAGTETWGPYFYAAISDELRRRGVKDVNRYLTEHPHHVSTFKELNDELPLDSPFPKREHASVLALLFTEDDDPERTKESILRIVNDRKVSDLNLVRQTLVEINGTTAPLMDGAL
jgi:hypothetical protein